MTHSSKRNIIILAVLALFALTSVVPTASAVNCDAADGVDCMAIGFIKLSGKLGLTTVEAKAGGHPDVRIMNSTNASQASTTNATGQYWIRYMRMGVNSFVINATHEFGYSIKTDTITVVDQNVSQNFTIEADLATISGETESGITKNGATISGTLINSTIGSYLEYSTDSALTNNVWTTSWSNSTATPSFTLSNLQSNTKYYWRMTAYNQYDNNNSDTSDTIGDITTLRAGTSSSYVTPTQAPVQQNAIQQLISPKTANDRKKQIFVGMVILAIGVLYYYGMLGGKKK